MSPPERELSPLVSFLRIAAGTLTVGALVLVMTPILLVLLPWRARRVRVTNLFGGWIGRVALWWAGAEVDVVGAESIDGRKPAIYAFNHTSILDAFTTIWVTPSGTVGVAKKEVFYYPFYGQAWWLAGHVFLDRGRTERAKAALRRTAGALREGGLSLCILPEGTRSESGRLLPFKKGIVHMAIETGLPIVPVVTTGLHGAWRRGSLRLRKVKAQIRVLPPISTEGWAEETMDAHLETLRAPFLAALPPDQQPAAEGRPAELAAG